MQIQITAEQEIDVKKGDIVVFSKGFILMTEDCCSIKRGVNLSTGDVVFDGKTFESVIKGIEIIKKFGTYQRVIPGQRIIVKEKER